MSKEAALALMNGGNPMPVTPSLITQDMPASPDAEAAPQTAKQDLDSDRFARLAAREAKLQSDRELLKSEQQRAYEEKSKLKEVQDKLSAYYELKKTDPIAALKSLDFSDEDIFNAFSTAAEKKEITTEQRALTTAEQAMATVEAFKKEQADKVLSEQKARDDRNIAAFKEGITKAVAADTDKYEFCNYYGAIADELVYGTVLEIMREDKEVAPHEAMKEAMDLVENLYEKEAEEMSKLKKRQLKVEEPTVAKPPQKTTTLVNKPPPATLTNKAAATVASQATTLKKESMSEKKERLANQIRNYGLKAR